MKDDFKLDFVEAMTLCLTENKLIVGERFSPGLFCENHNGTVILREQIDGAYQDIGDMTITTGVINQKYKTIVTANDYELGIGQVASKSGNI